MISGTSLRHGNLSSDFSSLFHSAKVSKSANTLLLLQQLTTRNPHNDNNTAFYSLRLSHTYSYPMSTFQLPHLQPFVPAFLFGDASSAVKSMHTHLNLYSLLPPLHQHQLPFASLTTVTTSPLANRRLQLSSLHLAEEAATGLSQLQHHHQGTQPSHDIQTIH